MPAASGAGAGGADEKTPQAGAKKKRPIGHHVNVALAVVVVISFLGCVWWIGREVGLWGDVRGGRVLEVAQRPLTPEEKLARDRYVSRANLERLGSALELWARQNKGMYPARLGQVTEAAELTPDMMRSPFAAEGAESYRYLYFRSMGVAMHKETVIAYDVAELAAGEGANVLFGNGEVRWVKAGEFEAAVARSEAERLGLAEGEVVEGDGRVAVRGKKRRKD